MDNEVKEIVDDVIEEVKTENENINRLSEEDLNLISSTIDKRVKLQMDDFLKKYLKNNYNTKKEVEETPKNERRDLNF